MNKRNLFSLLAVLLLSFLLIESGWAQNTTRRTPIKGLSIPTGFGIAPIRVDLSAKQAMQSITITNFTTESAVFQVELKKWDRKNGQDVYTDTRDILVSPPIFKIDPTQQQIIRVAIRKPNTTNQEQSYRIFIRQVQTKVNTDVTAQNNTINMVVRLGVPVYVAPVNVIKKVNWSASQVNNNTLKVRMQNGGNTQVVVSQLNVTLPNEKDKPLGSSVKGVSISPNQSQEITLTLNAPLTSKTVHVIARTNQGDMESDVTLK